jgi:hypothetical protein
MHPPVCKTVTGTGEQVGYADTLKISLAVKKALVDREMLDVTQVLDPHQNSFSH